MEGNKERGERLEKEVEKVIELIEKHKNDKEFWQDLAERVQEIVDCDTFFSEGFCSYPDGMDGLVTKIKFFFDDKLEVVKEEDAEKINGILLCTNCLSYEYHKDEPLRKRLYHC